MKNNHLSEAEIQEYASGDPDGKVTIDHLVSCEHCRAKVDAYRLLFSGIRQQPRPGFDFDLSALVLAQLPQPRQESASKDFSVLRLILIAISILGITIYLIRQNLSILFADISAISIYIILATTLSIILIKILGMYKKYQKQMRSLNFH